MIQNQVGHGARAREDNCSGPPLPVDGSLPRAHPGTWPCPEHNYVSPEDSSRPDELSKADLADILEAAQAGEQVLWGHAWIEGFSPVAYRSKADAWRDAWHAELNAGFGTRCGTLIESQVVRMRVR